MPTVKSGAGGGGGGGGVDEGGEAGAEREQEGNGRRFRVEMGRGGLEGGERWGM